MRPLVTCLQIAAVAFAILSGVFLGVFSCGGSVWYKQAIGTIISFFSVAALVARFWTQGFAPWRSAGFIALVVAAFYLSEACAAPFYPAPPASWSEFWDSFIRTLQYGPC